MFVSQRNKFYCKCTRDCEATFRVLSEQVHSQYLSGCKSISNEGVVLDQFNKLKPSTIPMAQFFSRLYDEIDQLASTTSTHISIIIQFILTKEMIHRLFTTMWYHMGG